MDNSHSKKEIVSDLVSRLTEVSDLLKTALSKENEEKAEAITSAYLILGRSIDEAVDAPALITKEYESLSQEVGFADASTNIEPLIRRANRLIDRLTNWTAELDLITNRSSLPFDGTEETRVSPHYYSPSETLSTLARRLEILLLGTLILLPVFYVVRTYLLSGARLQDQMSEVLMFSIFVVFWFVLNDIIIGLTTAKR